MDYQVIFNDLDKIKNILSTLFKSELNSNIKEIFQKMDNNIFKNVVETQYLYMYCKLLNILKNNKSIKIITLEQNLLKIKDKSTKEVISILNTLGYYDLLLVLLNVSAKVLQEIRAFIKTKNKVSLTVNNVDLNKLNFKNFDNLAHELSSKIISKLEPKVNIQFNQNSELKSNNNKLVEKQDEDIVIPDNMPMFEDSSDDIDTMDELSDEELSDNELSTNLKTHNKTMHNENIKNDMKKLKNNIVNEYEEETLDKNKKVTKVKKILNNNDLKLIELLNN